MARLSRKLGICTWVGLTATVLVIALWAMSGLVATDYACFRGTSRFRVSLFLGVLGVGTEEWLPSDIPRVAGQGYVGWTARRCELWALPESGFERLGFVPPSLWRFTQADIKLLPGSPGPQRGLEVQLPLWMLLLLSGDLTALAFLRDRRRQRSGRCAQCGYDLTGNVSGVCPECGTAIPEKQRALLACSMIEENPAVASSGPDRALGDGVGHPRKTKENMP